LAQWFLEEIFKDFPIEENEEMFYPIVAPHNPEDHGLNKIDSAQSELLWYCGS
jgi:hypothetical protein